MNVEIALYAMLHDHAGVQSIVADRIYPIYLPQSPTFPACAYNRTSSRTISALKADTNLIEARFEVAAFSKSYDECIQLADQIRQALQRNRGSIAGVVVEDVTIDDINDAYEPDFEIHESTIDVSILYRT